jgi:hypothetical protein
LLTGKKQAHADDMEFCRFSPLMDTVRKNRRNSFTALAHARFLSKIGFRCKPACHSKAAPAMGLPGWWCGDGQALKRDSLLSFLNPL